MPTPSKFTQLNIASTGSLANALTGFNTALAAQVALSSTATVNIYAAGLSQTIDTTNAVVATYWANIGYQTFYIP